MTEPMITLSEDDFQPVKAGGEEGEGLTRPSLSFYREAFLHLSHSKAALVCFLILILMFLFAIFCPLVSPFDYAAQNVAFSNKPFFSPDPISGAVHLFGTDYLGRDIFIRIWYGARISLTVAVSVAVIDCVVGVVYGGISAYVGGGTDRVMMGVLEVISGIPYLIIVLLLMAVLPRGMATLMIAYSITGWTGMARLVRGQVMGLKHQEFMIAARIMGVGWFRVMVRHLIPNLLSIIIVNITLDIPGVIFTEAFLSLLGMGIAPPYPSWGVMVNDGIGVFQSYPLQLAVPGFCICLTMLSFNLLGDKMQDALDPKQRRPLRFGRNIKSK